MPFSECWHGVGYTGGACDMTLQSEIIIVRFDATQLTTILYHARAKTIEGVSWIVPDRDKRNKLNYGHQVTGQLCTAAFHLYLTGDMETYDGQRQEQNKTPYKGDGGFDFPGVCIDVKGTKIRAGWQPIQYSLLVRPQERHTGWVYVHGIADYELYPEGGFRSNPVVYLTGWATDEELPDKPYQPPPGKQSSLAGAYRIAVRYLHPLMPMKRVKPEVAVPVDEEYWRDLPKM